MATSKTGVSIAEIETSQFPEQFLTQKVEWEKCELYNNQKKLRKAECADITVPLHWDSPGDGTMTVHVKRLKSLLKATKQIWYLEGGPGWPGTYYLFDFMKLFPKLDSRIDFYSLDHRGTGYSERLTCPDQEDEESEEGKTISENEWDACMDYLEDTYNLDAFTVTDSAKDLGLLIELERGENQSIFVYGVSYGTYWAQRYAQIFPDQADGVILDSVVTPIGYGFDQYDIDATEAVKDFLNVCKEDAFCRSKMGDDPWGQANATFEKFKNGHCKELSENELAPEFLQELAFGALDYWYLRIALPAFYYRIDRCNEKDVKAIRYALDNFLPLLTGQSALAEDSSVPRPYSPALQYHIGLSEIMSENLISVEDMEEIDKTLLASQHFSLRCLRLLEKWPTYETDDYYHNWVSQDVPILMFNGTLDQRTHIDRVMLVRDTLTGPNQYFVEIPNAVHGVCLTGGSPIKNIFAPDCGMQIMLNYIEDPLEEPDTSCLDDLMPVDFHGNPLLALLLFGTWDLWENGINTSLSDDQILLMEEEAKKILDDLRKRWSRLR